MAVFVSHSKNDQDLMKYFALIFTNVGLKSKFMEWEDLGNKYAGKEIAEIIRGKLFGENISDTIVLLGHGLQNPSNTPQFTHNWVNFEVGVTAGSQKPVWVFEDFSQFIQFPIPYVTDYCRYTLDNTLNLKEISDILNQRIVLKNQNYTPVYKVKCPYPNCSAEYRYWSRAKTLNCPVCRQSITLQ